MKHFNVIGSTAGDGGQVVANDFFSAWIKFCELDVKMSVSDKEIEKQRWNENAECVDDDEYQYGDYRIVDVDFNIDLKKDLLQALEIGIANSETLIEKNQLSRAMEVLNGDVLGEFEATQQIAIDILELWKLDRQNEEIDKLIEKLKNKDPEGVKISEKTF
jgi:hypothetical protein